MFPRLSTGWIVAVMVLVPLLLELVFIWGPALASIALSFSSWDGFNPLGDAKFVGLRNYNYVVNEYVYFWPAVRHNLYWLAFFVLVPTPIGVLLAVVLDRLKVSSGVFEAVFFLPVMLSMVLIGVIWQFVYSGDAGLLNSILGIFSFEPVDWFGDQRFNLIAALVAASWQQVGLVMILYLAGLKGFDQSLREAAALDGASETRTFFLVVLPVMRPINIIVVIVTFINSLRAFDIVWAINMGTNGLELLNVLVVKFLQGAGFQLGNGAAVGAILLVGSLIPVIIYLRIVFKDREQYGRR